MGTVLMKLETDPPWLEVAWDAEGQKEVPGPSSNSWLEKMWLRLPGGRWFWEELGRRDDNRLPWCGAFVAKCFADCKMAFPKHYARALAWAEWGQPLQRPIRGCVVVFSRLGGGHVGFVLGQSEDGGLLVLGGNQNDAVRVSRFSRSAVRAYRWPAGEPVPVLSTLGFGHAPASTSQE